MTSRDARTRSGFLLKNTTIKCSGTVKACLSGYCYQYVCHGITSMTVVSITLDERRDEDSMKEDVQFQLQPQECSQHQECCEGQ